MRKPHFVLLIGVVFLGFGVSFCVPPEDVPETPYDESETVPYEDTPLFSIEVPQASVWIPKAKAELSCDSLTCVNSLTKPHNARRENSARPHCVPDSLTTLNHSFRC